MVQSHSLNWKVCQVQVCRLYTNTRVVKAKRIWYLFLDSLHVNRVHNDAVSCSFACIVVYVCLSPSWKVLSTMPCFPFSNDGLQLKQYRECIKNAGNSWFVEAFNEGGTDRLLPLPEGLHGVLPAGGCWCGRDRTAASTAASPFGRSPWIARTRPLYARGLCEHGGSTVILLDEVERFLCISFRHSDQSSLNCKVADAVAVGRASRLECRLRQKVRAQMTWKSLTRESSSCILISHSLVLEPSLAILTTLTISLFRNVTIRPLPMMMRSKDNRWRKTRRKIITLWVKVLKIRIFKTIRAIGTRRPSQQPLNAVLADEMR